MASKSKSWGRVEGSLMRLPTAGKTGLLCPGEVKPLLQQSQPPARGLACILNPRAATRAKNEEREGPTVPVLRHTPPTDRSIIPPIIHPDVECPSLSPDTTPSSTPHSKPRTSRDACRFGEGHSLTHVQSVKAQFCHGERKDFKSPITLLEDQSAPWRSGSIWRVGLTAQPP